MSCFTSILSAVIVQSKGNNVPPCAVLRSCSSLVNQHSSEVYEPLSNLGLLEIDARGVFDILYRDLLGSYFLLFAKTHILKSMVYVETVISASF
jgi:hypothetical protein